MAWITHESFPHEHSMKGGDEVEVGCKAACQETATLNELMQLRKPSPEICNTKISWSAGTEAELDFLACSK